MLERVTLIAVEAQSLVLPFLKLCRCKLVNREVWFNPPYHLLQMPWLLELGLFYKWVGLEFTKPPFPLLIFSLIDAAQGNSRR